MCYQLRSKLFGCKIMNKIAIICTNTVLLMLFNIFV